MIFCTLHCICARCYCIISHSTEKAALKPPSNITTKVATTTTVSVSWPQVSGATGYYVSYQRQDLGAPPVVTPQYERIVGGATTSVTLSGLEPGTTYRIRVWSTNVTSVSNETVERNGTTVENGEKSVITMYMHILCMDLAAVCVIGSLMHHWWHIAARLGNQMWQELPGSGTTG